jgi:hypothetical protein
MKWLDQAVAVNVAVLGGVTFGWLLGVLVTAPGPAAAEIAAGSPIVGITFPTLAMRFYTSGEWENLVRWWAYWIAVHVSAAAAIAWGPSRLSTGASVECARLHDADPLRLALSPSGHWYLQKLQVDAQRAGPDPPVSPLRKRGRRARSPSAP